VRSLAADLYLLPAQSGEQELLFLAYIAMPLKRIPVLVPPLLLLLLFECSS
jgi:hypothetical protein